METDAQDRAALWALRKEMRRPMSSREKESSDTPPPGGGVGGATTGQERRKQGQGEHPDTMIEKSEEMVKLAMGGNVIITAAKFIAWCSSGSRWGVPGSLRWKSVLAAAHAGAMLPVVGAVQRDVERGHPLAGGLWESSPAARRHPERRQRTRQTSPVRLRQVDLFLVAGLGAGNLLAGRGRVPSKQ